MTAFDEMRLLPATRRALREVVAVRAVLTELEARLVVMSRDHGVSWGELASDLGISRQGARQRHLAVDPVAARRPKPRSALDEFYAELPAAAGRRRLQPPELEPHDPPALGGNDHA